VPKGFVFFSAIAASDPLAADRHSRADIAGTGE
jgi:hypothetical protein